MHQQPPTAPRSPKRSSSAGHSAAVSGRMVSVGPSFAMPRSRLWRAALFPDDLGHPAEVSAQDLAHIGLAAAPREERLGEFGQLARGRYAHGGTLAVALALGPDARVGRRQALQVL